MSFSFSVTGPKRDALHGIKAAYQHERANAPAHLHEVLDAVQALVDGATRTATPDLDVSVSVSGHFDPSGVGGVGVQINVTVPKPATSEVVELDPAPAPTVES